MQNLQRCKDRTVTGMDEYIERRAAHDAVVDAIWHGKRSMYSVANAINSVPTANVAPVVHGRWRKTYTCSGEWLWGYECDQCKADSPRGSYYCPNCGARMDLEEPNETKET